MVSRFVRPDFRGLVPFSGVVAGPAVFRRLLVAAVLTLGDDAVVARVTPANDVIVAHPDLRPVGGIAVAIFTDIGRARMRRILTLRGGAIVATDAIAGHAAVAERRVGKG